MWSADQLALVHQIVDSCMEQFSVAAPGPVEMQPEMEVEVIRCPLRCIRLEGCW